jgi:hypothetical protein
MLLAMAHPAHGYASWLKCYIELDDQEVVMHQLIVPADKAREEVAIEVQPYRSEKRGGHADEATTWVSGPDYQVGTSDVTTLRVRLRVPPSLQHMDVQFVIEATGGPGAEFIDLGVMCDGQRASSRRQDEYVILQINSTEGEAAVAGSKTDVELVAAWATGFEAVTLTPKMTLRRRPGPAVDCASDGSCEQEL